ncbi:MAG: GAF domain-containing protein, partial [Candidatus Rokuibacteriota bacterium]
MSRAIRVLVLEDRPADAELLVRELGRAGFALDWTRVDSEADYLAGLDPAPDVILADYSLPGFGAMQALGHLAARGLDIPLIVVSGTVGDEVAVECMRRGAADYLLKDRLARLGSAVSHVVEQKRVREQHRRAEEVAEALATVGRELTLTLDPAIVTDRIVATVGRLSRVRRVLLFRRDPDSELLVCIAASDAGDARRWIGQSVPLDASIAGLAFADCRPTWTADVLTDPRVMLSAGSFQRIREDGLRAVTAVPLRVRAEVLGVLSLEDAPGRVFSEGERRIFSAFADQAAVALQNARLFRETQDRLQQTEMLLAVGQATSSTLDRTEMLRRVAREAGRALGADMVAALVADADGDALRAVAGYHVPKPLLPALRQLRIPLRGHAFFVEAWEHQRAVFSTEVAADLRIEPRLLAYVPFRSLLFIPMLNRHDLVGGLLASWRSHVQEFTPETLRLAEGIGRQAAMGFESARLFEDAERRRRRIESLAALDRLLSESLDPGDVAQRIADSLRSLLDAGSAALYRLVPESRTLAPLAMSGAEGRKIDAVPPIPIGTGLVGLAVQEVLALTSPDALADPRVGAGPTTISTPEADHRALLAVPLVFHGRPIGALAVKDRAGRVFDADEVYLAEAFAERAAQALQNARHHA